ncbi:MAG: hypothetical protein JRC58_02615 [Deltaproteobacteria bacterium]|nr:hypothetical protein [Deltaproteobacteria bacterium]
MDEDRGACCRKLGCSDRQAAGPAWNSVLPEYDPFKYNSFAVNAGNAEYRKALLHAKAEPYELNKQAQQQEALNKFRASSG